MNLHTLIFTENACYKAGRKIIPQGIVVHSTGANNPNLKRYVGPDDGLLGVNQYANHWNQEMDRSVCVHGFIGKLADGTIATYQTLPWDHRGWHAGSGKNGSANNTHISFEICEDGLTDGEYFAKVYAEAVQLCAYLCKMFGFDPLADGVILDHKEAAERGLASNHGDVAHWFGRFGKSMDNLRADVAALMASEEDAAPENAEQITGGTEPAEHFDTARKGVYGVTAESGLRIRAGAGENKPILALLPKGTQVMCTGGYTDKWLRVETADSRVGFCHSEYLVKK